MEEKKKKLKVGCPYCTKEIFFDAVQCPWCGTSFGSKTMELLRSFANEGEGEAFDERRKEDRVPKKLKIAYSSPKALVNSYISNLGLGGLFIQTDQPLDKGSRFDLKISLPDGEKDLEVHCEVTWIRKEEKVTQKAKLPPGMGVRFLNFSPEDKKRIEKILPTNPTH